MIAAFRDGERIAALPLDYRAAHYGDGAFTTARVHAGRVVWWPLHLARLKASASALHLRWPGDAAFDWVTREAASLGAGVFKLALVPDAAGRGYARVWPSGCAVYGFTDALPTVAANDLVADWSARVVETGGPLGIKTVSRLDQVLAAPISPDRATLLADRDGCVVGAQSANVWALFGTVWATPPVGGGTIAGVARERLLQSPPAGFSVRVQTMHREALYHADAVILCNAVRGIMPLRALGTRTYPPHPAVVAWQRAIHPELGLSEC